MHWPLSNQAQHLPALGLACAAGTIRQNHIQSRYNTKLNSLIVRFYTLQRYREGFLNDGGVNVQVWPHMIRLGMAGGWFWMVVHGGSLCLVPVLGGGLREKEKGLLVIIPAGAERCSRKVAHAQMWGK